MARNAAAAIVDLAVERGRRRLASYEARLRTVLDDNRAALSSLFATGSIFSRRGSRVGRDLLLAHQHLLRLKDLLAKVVEMAGPLPSAVAPEVELLYAELDTLLAKTAALTLKTSARIRSKSE